MLTYVDRLQRLALNLPGAVEPGEELGAAAMVLDARTLALVRLSALVAVGGAGPSFGELADAAVDAGASPAEIVDVLTGIVPVVGLPCVVAAAPKLALALGYDTDAL